jgi:hypothetical protein
MFFGILFSSALSLCSFNVTDQVSHPYKSTGTITVLHIVICALCKHRVWTDLFYLKERKGRKGREKSKEGKGKEGK